MHRKKDISLIYAQKEIISFNLCKERNHFIEFMQRKKKFH